MSASLDCLNREKKQLRLSKKERKVINALRKRDNDSQRLKKIIKLGKSSICTPSHLLEVIRNNQLELIRCITGKHLNSEKVQPTSKEDKKSLPLDTNYKYPTKTSKSIWTVKNK